MISIQYASASPNKRIPMAKVTFRGREHSQLPGFVRIGPYALNSIAGQYDLLGNPTYSDGEILTETLYRFKRQFAPASTRRDFRCARICLRQR